MIGSIIINIVVNSVILYVVATYVPQLGFAVHASGMGIFIAYLLLGAVFRILYGVLKKIIDFVTFPIKFLTFGLSTILINIGIFYLFEYVINTQVQRGITLELGTLLQVLLLSIVVGLLNFILKRII